MIAPGNSARVREPTLTVAVALLSEGLAMRVGLAGLTLLSMCSAAGAADYRQEPIGFVEPYVIRAYPPVRVIRTEPFPCARCRGDALPWGGLRKTYKMGLPWGGLRDDCAPVRPVRRVVISVKG
jgi:hypothetical protein